MATWAKGIDFKNSGNTTRIGGVGVYGTDSSSEKIYIGLGTEPWNNAGLQLSKTAINFKGNKIYHAGDKPTASEIGAAASSHSHNYAGASSSGGSATSAAKLDTATAGSSTQPVYFSGGKPAACTYTLGKSVPSNAVFTDTNTWRPVQDNLTSTSTSDALSANQGRVLKSLVDGKANTSGTYAGLVGKGNVIHDTRSSNRAPNFYDRQVNRYDFVESSVLGCGGDFWSILQTISPWVSFDGGHRQQQLVFKGSGGLGFRYATSDTTWSSWYTIYSSLNKPSPADIGAAAASHGTHVSYGGNGSASTVSRSDHSHSYLPLSGGTLTGTLSVSMSNQTAKLGATSDKVYLHNGAANKFLEFRNDGTLAIDGRLIGTIAYPIAVSPSGAWWSRIAPIDGQGVMNIGRYINFHSSHTDTSTFNTQLTSDSSAFKITYSGTQGWFGLYRKDGSRYGYIGNGSDSNENFVVNGDIGHLTLHASATGGTISFYPQAKYTYTDGHSVPDKDNLYFLGTTSPARRWKQLCAVSGSIATSDTNYKTNIEPIINEDEPMTLSISDKIHNPSAFSKTIDTNKATKKDYYNFIRDTFKPYSYEYTINEVEGDTEFSLSDKQKLAKSIGFVADEYDLVNDKVAKEFIFQTDDGLLNYSTTNYTTVVAIALKEAIKEIELLKEEILMLKQK